jgi:hypothetical protein
MARTEEMLLPIHLPRRLALALFTLSLGGAACDGLAPVPLADPDVDDDGVVSAADADFVTACFGHALALDPGCGPADVDRDGDVDFADAYTVAGRQGARVCNGAAELCDRRYDEVAYATTHNAFAASSEGWVFANQTPGLSQQLADGVRGLMLDVWEWPTGSHVPYLCHGTCELGQTPGLREPLVDGLTRIRAFLDAHPAEVVTLILESYVSAADFAAAFAASGLLPYALAHTIGTPWPTLEQMIDAGSRVVVLTDSGGGAYPWYLPVFGVAFETDFDNATPADFSCVDNRGSPGSDLFILNHFLTQLLGQPALADLVNHEPYFGDRARECWRFQGRIPNFVTVDFYEIGDLLAVTRSLNLDAYFGGGAPTP